MRIPASFVVGVVLLFGAGWTDAQSPPPALDHQPGAAAREYMAFFDRACDRVEADLPKLTHVAEIAADRHIKGGVIGIPWNGQGLQDELWGRSGGLMHIGNGRPFRKDRTEDEKKQDVAIVGWQRSTFSDNLSTLRNLKADGTYVIGFGPWAMPELKEYVEVCDAWFDTGFGIDDRVLAMADGSKAGRGNLLIDMLYGWAFTAEFVAALTRQGKMPPMWQAYLYDEGLAWGDKYLGKMQFHDDYDVPPIAAGELTRRYLERMKELVAKLDREQLANINRAADLIVTELELGQKTVCASMGHAPWTYVGQYEDQAWVQNAHLHTNSEPQVEQYLSGTLDGALVLHLGYFGTDAKALEIFNDKKQRLMYISNDTPRDGEMSELTGFTIKSVPDDALVYIDMGMAYGDACVALAGYPHRILPPSGIMQLIAYECVNVEVLSRLAASSSE